MPNAVHAIMMSRLPPPPPGIRALDELVAKGSTLPSPAAHDDLTAVSLFSGSRFVDGNTLLDVAHALPRPMREQSVVSSLAALGEAMSRFRQIEQQDDEHGSAHASQAADQSLGISGISMTASPAMPRATEQLGVLQSESTGAGPSSGASFLSSAARRSASWSVAATPSGVGASGTSSSAAALSSLGRLPPRAPVAASTGAGYDLPSGTAILAKYGLNGNSTVRGPAATPVAVAQSPASPMPTAVEALPYTLSAAPAAAAPPAPAAPAPAVRLPQPLLVTGDPHSEVVARVNAILEPLAAETSRLVSKLVGGVDLIAHVPVAPQASWLQAPAATARRRCRLQLQPDGRTVAWAIGADLRGEFSVAALQAVACSPDGLGFSLHFALSADAAASLSSAAVLALRVQSGSFYSASSSAAGVSSGRLELSGPDRLLVADILTGLSLLHDITPVPALALR